MTLAKSLPGFSSVGKMLLRLNAGCTREERAVVVEALPKRLIQQTLLVLFLFLTMGELSAQTCTVTDYLYLNDVTPSGGYVHKLRLNAGISATEIYSSGTKPWFPAGGILDTPHGLGQDLNGNLYIGQTGDGPIAKIKCNGTVVNASFINDGGFNIVSKDGYLYIDDNGTNRINRYSLCDGSAQGYIVLNGDFSYGSETLKDWGMEIDPDGTFYVTAGFNVLNNNKNTYIYRFKPTNASFTAHTAYTAQLITGVGVSLKPGTGDNGISNTNEVWGITHDPAGNMYVVVRDRTDDTNKETWILKYDKNFNLVDYIMEKDDTPTGGIEGARGIVYYAPWDRLLIAGGPDGDCVAKVRPSDMAYTGALAPNEPGQTPKTLRIASEACPTAANLTVDTTMCNVQVGDKVFLQNIIGTCKVPICGGTWTASAGNAGITFNECDLSFTVTNVAIGCGKFTLTNVGGTCGNFTITVNVDFADVTAPVIAGDQIVCGTLAPTPFTVTTAATTSGTKPIKYQWQKSTTSCTAGFSTISGATSSTYAAAFITRTTYYRVFVTVDGSCATPKGSCADTSNCVTVTYVNSALNITASPGVCLPATNKYSVSGVVSLTNAIAGTAKITDGTATTTLTVAAGATSIAYTLTGLTSDGLTHTVSVSTDCGTDVVTYKAPASCSVAPCALNVLVTPGTCNSATNQYSISGTVSLTSAVAGTMTITDGAKSTTVAVAANQASAAYTLTGFTSNGANHTVVATLAGCGTDNATYVAPASCTVCTVNLTTTSLPNGQVGTAYSQTMTTTGGTTPYTYAVSTGTLPTGLNLNPTTGVISGTPTTAATSVFTIEVTDAKSCTDVVSLTIVTAPLPVCSQNLVVTPGTCNSATNQYSISGTVSLTNAVAGTLTITDGSKSTTIAVTASTTSVAYTLTGLVSGSGSHTVISSLAGCGSDNAVYAAPTSCTVAPCALNLVVTPGNCNSATNQYSISGTVAFTSAVASTLTITDGIKSIALAVTASTISLSYSLTGLVSGSGSHTVVATLTGCGTDNATYVAPASCTVCTANLITSTLPNGQVGTAYSRTLVTSGGTTPYSYAVSTGTLPAGLSLNATTGVISGTPTTAATSVFTIKVTDAKSCTDVQSFTIVTAALPVCSLDLIVTPGTCNSVTNQYSISGTVTLTNPTVGNLVITDGTKSTTLTITASTTSVSYSLTGLTSGSGSHTVVASLAGCGTDNAAYTAPASCTVAPCALNVVVTLGTCNSATNQYSISGTVALTSAVAGTMTITDGVKSTTVAVAANQTSVSYTLSGFTSTGASHTVVATLTGCGSDNAIYVAPASCTVCTANLVTSTLPNGQVGTAYSRTLVTTGGTTPYSYAVSTGTLPTGLTLNPTTGVISGTPTAATTSVFTIKVTDAKSCTDVQSFTVVTSSMPVCSLDLIVTPGTCNSANNQYSISGTVGLTNPVAGNLVITDGTKSTTLTITASTTLVSYSLTGLTSGSGSHTVIASLSGCGTDNAAYTAPASCTVAPPKLAVVVGTPVCNSVTNNYTATGTVSLSNAVAGTLTITDNGSPIGTITVTAGQATASFSVSGISNVASHMVIATLNGLSATTIYVAPASCTVCSLSLVTTSLPRGQVGTAYNQTIRATGGTLPYSFSVGAGTLPAGLTLNSATGVLSGTPTVSGIFPLTLVVSDARGCTAKLLLSVFEINQIPQVALAIVVNSPVCNSATNTYVATGTVSLTNSPAGSLTITDGSTTIAVIAVTAGQTTANFSVTGVSNGPTVQLVRVTLGTLQASTSYTTPALCTSGAPTYAIAKVVNQSRVEKGGIVTYTVSLTNTGNATGTNIVVGDQLSTTAVSFVGSATASVGTFLPTGNSGNWTIASLGAGQVATLSFKVQINEEGLTYNTATSPTGQTVTACLTVPFHVCANSDFEFELAAPASFGTYQWSRNGVPIAGATSESLSVTAIGEYTVATTSAAGCSDGSCCPFVVVADAVPSLTAVGIAASCTGSTPLDNASISLVSSSTNAVSYNISAGTSFTASAPLFASDQPLSGVVGGVLLANQVNPGQAPGNSYTIRVYAANGCYSDTVVVIPPAQCQCPPVKCAPFVVKKVSRR